MNKTICSLILAVVVSVSCARIAKHEVSLPVCTSLEVLQTHQIITGDTKIEAVRQFMDGLSGEWTRSIVTQRSPEFMIEVKTQELVSARILIGNDWIAISTTKDKGTVTSNNPPEKVLSSADKARLLKLLSS